MTDGKYILRYGVAVAEPDLMKWARWMETADRVVMKTELELCRVSTVFLGLDHRFGGGDPLLWETMVFPLGDSGFDSYMERYSSPEDAVVGHAVALNWARKREAELKEKVCKELKSLGTRSLASTTAVNALKKSLKERT